MGGARPPLSPRGFAAVVVYWFFFASRSHWLKHSFIRRLWWLSSCIISTWRHRGQFQQFIPLIDSCCTSLDLIYLSIFIHLIYVYPPTHNNIIKSAITDIIVDAIRQVTQSLPQCPWCTMASVSNYNIGTALSVRNQNLCQRRITEHWSGRRKMKTKHLVASITWRGGQLFVWLRFIYSLLRNVAHRLTVRTCFDPLSFSDPWGKTCCAHTYCHGYQIILHTNIELIYRLPINYSGHLSWEHPASCNLPQDKILQVLLLFGPLLTPD